jgi:hypothetical protein
MAATRLRDRMREDLELRGVSPGTIAIYLRCARRFAEHFRAPAHSGCRFGVFLHRTRSTSTKYSSGRHASSRPRRPNLMSRSAGAQAP